VREKLRHIPAKKVMTDHSRQLTKKVYICVCKGTDEIRRSINIVVDFFYERNIQVAGSGWGPWGVDYTSPTTRC
jgi:hypothetical protein